MKLANSMHFESDTAATRSIREEQPEGRSMLITARSSPRLSGRLKTWPGKDGSHVRKEVQTPPLHDSGAWDWKKGRMTLQRMPAFYALDRSSTTVNMPLMELLGRIDNFLRLKSIGSHFHRDGHVDCHISGVLRFELFLWRGDVGNIIVELQRREGCSVYMQRIRSTLFRYLLTGEEPDASPLVHCYSSKAICPQIKQLYEAEMKRKASCVTSFATSQENLCHDNMNICQELLDSEYNDQNRLGMESLAMLTDAALVNNNIAKIASKALLADNNEPCAQTLREELVHYFTRIERPNPNQQHTSPWGGPLLDDDDELEEYAEGPEFGVLHNIALRTLCNALHVLAKEQELNQNSPKVQIHLHSHFWRTIARALVYNLRVAVHRPEEAAWSAKCICLLEDLAPGAVHLLIHDKLVPKLLAAQDYGKAHHWQLEKESRDLLGRLGAAH